MCTVTYIPTEKGFFFTSNRDEKTSRVTFPPVTYNTNGIELIYPKDETAGGTWIASCLKGKTACLLNGAFLNHRKQNDYARSRGLILLESFNFQNTLEFSEKVNLNKVEPFTLLALDYSSGILDSFFEFRWDGEKKYLKQLVNNECQIWSSATLYSPSVQLVRQQLFNNWVTKYKDFDDRMILDFHNRKHGLNEYDDILMQREGDLTTLSISQVSVDNTDFYFNYFDIINKKKYKIKLSNQTLVNV